MENKRFPLGKITVSEAAYQAIYLSGGAVSEFLTRHASGDWGEVGETTALSNDRDLAEGRGALLSLHPAGGKLVSTLTDLDRNETRMKLSEELGDEGPGKEDKRDG